MTVVVLRLFALGIRYISPEVQIWDASGDVGKKGHFLATSLYNKGKDGCDYPCLSVLNSACPFFSMKAALPAGLLRTGASTNSSPSA